MVFFGDHSETVNCTTISVFDHLKHLKQLQIFLYDYPQSVWTDVQPSIRSALLRLMHLPSILILDLFGVAEISPSDIAPCKNLDYLKINNTLFKEDCEPSEVVKCNKLHLDTHDSIQNIINILQRSQTSGKSIIDFDRIKELSLSLDPPGPRSEYNQLLRGTHGLEVLQLCVRGAYPRQY